jgi:hypothetical protein
MDQDDPVILDRITLPSGRPPDQRSDDDDDDGPRGGGSSSGSGESKGRAITVYPKDIEEILEQFDLSPNATVRLRTIDDFIDRRGDDIAAKHRANYDLAEDFMSDMPGYTLDDLDARVNFTLSIAANPPEGGIIRPDDLPDSEFRNSLIASIQLETEGYSDAIREIAAGASVAEGYLEGRGIDTSYDGLFVTVGDKILEGAEDILDEDILAATGIDISKGIIKIDPGKPELPDFALPRNSGMVGFDTDDPNYHEYEFTYDVPPEIRGEAGLQIVYEELRRNPTPGDDENATRNGTPNNVGGLVPGDGGTNEVYSHTVPNPNPNQSDLVVNYTNDYEHGLASGYVTRYVQKTEDETLTIVTYGEGNSPLQGDKNPFADGKAEEAWEENSMEIIEAIGDGGLLF